jgi:DNA mismatch repair protein MSH4
MLASACPVLTRSAAQGRATSTSDGFAIAFAASEHLLSVGALTLCATHMERLCDLCALYAGCKHCHLRVVALNDRLQFVHELTEGADNLHVHYGLLLARSVGLPPPVLQRAEVVVEALQRKQANVGASEASVFSLSQQLLALAQSGDAATARDTLRTLRAAAFDIAQHGDDAAGVSQ